MKKWMSTVCIAFICISGTLLLGCTDKQEQKQPQKEKKQTKEEIKKEEPLPEEKTTYTFVDVLGQSYEAELLKTVPLSNYDYSRLVWEDGRPYYRAEDGSPRSQLGVDVSKYQGDVDFTQVKDAGMEFVIVRLGFRGYGGEGKLVLDEYYNQNVQGALNAGLKVGVYFFSQAITNEEAEEEAQFVLEHTKDYQIDGPIVFDTEEIKNDVARTDHLTKEEFTAHCIAFCDTIKATGKTPMIYANMKWMAFTLDLEKLTAYEKWYADYEPTPQCPYEFTIWQYTESGSVPGIQGNADINVWFQE